MGRGHTHPGTHPPSQPGIHPPGTQPGNQAQGLGIQPQIHDHAADIPCSATL